MRSRLTLTTLALSWILLMNCSHAPGPVIQPEPQVIVREVRPVCALPAVPPRPSTLGGEILPDGRVALTADALAAMNLWMAATYERMVADEACH